MKIEKSTLERIIKEELTEEILNELVRSRVYTVKRPRKTDRDGEPSNKVPGGKYDYSAAEVIATGIEKNKSWEELVDDVEENGDFDQEDAEHMVASAIIAVTGKPPGEYQKGTAKKKGKKSSSKTAEKFLKKLEKSMKRDKRQRKKVEKWKEKFRAGDVSTPFPPSPRTKRKKKRAAQRTARLNENKISIKYTLTEQRELKWSEEDLPKLISVGAPWNVLGAAAGSADKVKNALEGAGIDPGQYEIKSDWHENYKKLDAQKADSTKADSPNALGDIKAKRKPLPRGSANIPQPPKMSDEEMKAFTKAVNAPLQQRQWLRGQALVRDWLKTYTQSGASRLKRRAAYRRWLESLKGVDAKSVGVYLNDETGKKTLGPGGDLIKDLFLEPKYLHLTKDLVVGK